MIYLNYLSFNELIISWTSSESRRIRCKATSDTRARLLPDLLNTVAQYLPCSSILSNLNHTDLTQFILDPTSLNLPVSARISPSHPDLCHVLNSLSSYEDKIEFQIFKTWFFFHNSPVGVPIAFISLDKCSGKILSLKNEKSEKSRHTKVRVHRLNGIQNDRVGLTINEFFTVFKTIHQSQRNLQNTGEKRTEKQKNKLGLSCAKLRATALWAEIPNMTNIRCYLTAK